MGEFRVYNGSGMDITADFLVKGGQINNGTGNIVFPSNNGNDDNVDVVYSIIWKDGVINSNQSSVTVKECIDRSVLVLSSAPSSCLKSGDTFTILINSRDRAGNLVGPPNLNISVSDDTANLFKDYIKGTGSTGEFIIESGGELSDFKCVIKSVKKYDGLVPFDEEVPDTPMAILKISNGVSDDITCDIPICTESHGKPIPEVSIIYIAGQIAIDEEYGGDMGYRAYKARIVCSPALPNNVRINAQVSYHVKPSHGIIGDSTEYNCYDEQSKTVFVYTINSGGDSSDWKRFYTGRCVCELNNNRYCGSLENVSITKDGSNGTTVKTLKTNCGSCDCNDFASVTVDGIKYICNGLFIQLDPDIDTITD